jgi:hypothetical protein
MNEEAIKKRLRTAKIAAMSFLRKKGYEVIYCDDHRFDLVALKKRTVKFIKICTDKIMTEDKEKVQSFAPDFKSREIKRQIWLRKFNKKSFEIRNFYPKSNLSIGNTSTSMPRKVAKPLF